MANEPQQLELPLPRVEDLTRLEPVHQAAVRLKDLYEYCTQISDANIDVAIQKTRGLMIALMVVKKRFANAGQQNPLGASTTNSTPDNTAASASPPASDSNPNPEGSASGS